MPLYMPRGGPRIMFVHIPKTAGSSVTNYMVGRFGRPILTNTTTFKPGYRVRGFVTPPGHFTAQDLIEFLPADLDMAFAICREPISRLISEYRYQKLGGGRLASNFSRWLHFVLAAAKQDPRIYDNHIRPQTDFLFEACEVFRLEDGLDALVQRLDDVAGDVSEDKIQHANSSEAVKESVVVTKTDAERILEFYYKDYDLLGYAIPDLTRFPVGPSSMPGRAVGAIVAPFIVAHHHRKWLK